MSSWSWSLCQVGTSYRQCCMGLVCTNEDFSVSQSDHRIWVVILSPLPSIIFLWNASCELFCQYNLVSYRRRQRICSLIPTSMTVNISLYWGSEGRKDSDGCDTCHTVVVVIEAPVLVIAENNNTVTNQA